MNKIFENEEIVIYSEPSLDIINDSIVDNTIKKLNEYRKIFKKEKLAKLTVKFYDNLETYQEDYRCILSVEPPQYSKGWFDSENGNIYLHMNLEMLSKYKNYPLFWDQQVSCIAHEAFHYYYYLYYYGEDRITWFDEGMAQYISGEIASYTEYSWYKLFIDFIANYKAIDNLNERENGNSDVPDNLIFRRGNVFDGYAASLLAIKYLFDTKGEDYVFDIMFDNNRIREEGKDILNRMISYFNEVYSEYLQIKKS